MYAFFVAVHVVLCILMIGIILLQPGKGADPASAFGGGMSSAMFGPRGPTSVLSQATGIVAVLFMVTSVTLALWSTSTTAGSENVDSTLEQMLNKQKGAATDPEPAPAPEAPSAPDEGAPGDDVPGEDPQ